MKCSNQQMVQWIQIFIAEEKRNPTDRDFLSEKCPFSKGTLRRRFGGVNKALEAAGVPLSQLKIPHPKMEIPCHYCNKNFIRGFSRISKVTNNFCSMTCASIYNNKQQPKKISTWVCRDCDSTIKPAHRTKLCIKCNSKDQDMSLKELRKKYSGPGKHKAAVYALVRTRARRILRYKPAVCETCGYDYHVDVAHIKAISKYHEDTFISVINEPSNLKILCRNHHWEFDHPKKIKSH